MKTKILAALAALLMLLTVTPASAGTTAPPPAVEQLAEETTDLREIARRCVGPVCIQGNVDATRSSVYVCKDRSAPGVCKAGGARGWLPTNGGWSNAYFGWNDTDAILAPANCNLVASGTNTVLLYGGSNGKWWSVNDGVSIGVHYVC